MMHNNIEVEKVANNISNFFYRGNLQATKELMELFDKIPFLRELKNTEEYVNTYDDHFYTYKTWEDLVTSEAEQTDGLTEEECEEELSKTIWQLPCGWYVQYV
jgi:hypothetical protein